MGVLIATLPDVLLVMLKPVTGVQGIGGGTATETLKEAEAVAVQIPVPLALVALTV